MLSKMRGNYPSRSTGTDKRRAPSPSPFLLKTPLGRTGREAVDATESRLRPYWNTKRYFASLNRRSQVALRRAVVFLNSPKKRTQCGHEAKAPLG